MNTTKNPFNPSALESLLVKLSCLRRLRSRPQLNRRIACRGCHYVLRNAHHVFRIKANQIDKYSLKPILKHELAMCSQDLSIGMGRHRVSVQHLPPFAQSKIIKQKLWWIIAVLPLKPWHRGKPVCWLASGQPFQR